MYYQLQFSNNTDFLNRKIEQNGTDTSFGRCFNKFQYVFNEKGLFGYPVLHEGKVDNNVISNYSGINRLSVSVYGRMLLLTEMRVEKGHARFKKGKGYRTMWIKYLPYDCMDLEKYGSRKLGNRW